MILIKNVSLYRFFFVTVQNSNKYSSAITTTTSVKKQLVSIFRNLCQKAYEEIIQQPNIISQGNSKYKVLIANDLYQIYEKQGFRFSQPGTTPKQIAQDIQLHLINIFNIKSFLYQQKPLHDFDWQIDQFGNFKIKIKKSYHQKIIQNILSSKRFQHLSLNQYLLLNQNQFEKSKQNQIKKENFIFIINNFKGNTFSFFDNYRIFHYLSMMIRQRYLIQQKRGKQLINPLIYFKKVKKYDEMSFILNSFLQKNKKFNQIYKRLLNLDFSRMKLFQQYQLTSKIKNSKNSLITINYIGCLRNQLLKNQIQFKNILPSIQKTNFVKIGNVFPQEQEIDNIDELIKQINFKKINKLFALMKPTDPFHLPLNITQQNFKNMIQNYEEQRQTKIKQYQNKFNNIQFQSLIVQFGDLIQEFKFFEAGIILQIVSRSLIRRFFENNNQKYRNQYQNIFSIIKKSFDQITFSSSID